MIKEELLDEQNSKFIHHPLVRMCVIIMHGLMKRVKLLVYKALERETEDPIL
jgi:hypothetical protein